MIEQVSREFEEPFLYLHRRFGEPEAIVNAVVVYAPAHQNVHTGRGGRGWLHNSSIGGGGGMNISIAGGRLGGVGVVPRMPYPASGHGVVPRMPDPASRQHLAGPTLSFHRKNHVLRLFEEHFRHARPQQNRVKINIRYHEIVHQQRDRQPELRPMPLGGAEDAADGFYKICLGFRHSSTRA